MEARAWKVGELAARTGVSVRTLHHYHEIGLLVPACHSPGGQRLYLRADVERLQRILSLRQLGLSLQQIRTHLDDPAASPVEVVARHLRVLDERIEEQRRLRDRLGRHEEALEDYRKALALNPELAEGPLGSDLDEAAIRLLQKNRGEPT